MPQTLHVRAVPIADEGTEPVDFWVTPDGKVSAAEIDGAVTIQGRFVAPGLVDAHVHLTIDWEQRRPEDEASRVLTHAEEHARSGVLAVRDAGYVPAFGLDGLKFPRGLVIQQSGWMVTPPGRFWPGVEASKDTVAEELIDRVREVAGAGLSWFKFIADFPQMADGDFNLLQAPPTYPLEVVAEAVAEAHRLGLRVMAHSTSSFVGDLVDVGVDSIEHGMSVTPAVVEAMASRGTVWTPTLACIAEFVEMLGANGADAGQMEAWRRDMAASLPLAEELGVTVLVGTDEQPHGTIVSEMEAMVAHGLSPAYVLRAATTLGRAALGLPGLEEGAPADFVLYDDDPRRNLQAFAHPRAVVSEGVVLDLAAAAPA